MNKIKSIFFALVCAFFLFGCNAVEQTKSPTETLKALSEASKKKEPAAIKNHLSKGTLDLLQQSATRRETTVDELLKEEKFLVTFQNLNDIKNEQITGETAVVEVKNNVSGEFDKIPFVKENGVWKVALDVFMKDAIKRLNEEMNIPANNTSLPETESNKSAANTAINKK